MAKTDERNQRHRNGQKHVLVENERRDNAINGQTENRDEGCNDERAHKTKNGTS